jgi:hypothetical protein
LRSGLAGFVTGDRVHGPRGLCLFSLIWLRSVAIARSLFIHLFLHNLRSFPLSEMQYSCIISKSLFRVFGLRCSRYSPHGPRLRPAIAASMMEDSATSGALARSLMRQCKYSCNVDPSCFKLRKSHELTSLGFSALKAAVSSLRSWSQV